ncbi:hypothetical protein [Natronomonas marina]|jgi:hypothetical protein|uniref:hypothetical protein n=1 Tax=Natronomonas marina TaxID=2961939 RepID=UPI0020C9FAF9|nr:hypothetical protein [Natronomonas marina]
MVTVSYHCPRCGAVAELQRGAYLDDKCVTPDPLDGWTYADAHEAADADPDGDPYADSEGVVIVCGAAETDGDGCGEPYYLSFVKFDEGREVEPNVAVEEVRFDFRR